MSLSYSRDRVDLAFFMCILTRWRDSLFIFIALKKTIFFKKKMVFGVTNYFC